MPPHLGQGYGTVRVGGAISPHTPKLAAPRVPWPRPLQGSGPELVLVVGAVQQVLVECFYLLVQFISLFSPQMFISVS